MSNGWTFIFKMVVTTEGDMNITDNKSSQFRHTKLWTLICLSLVMASGCSVLHPVRGVPASYLPCELEGPSRSNKDTIHLGMLTRSRPDQHRCAAGDVLSIYVPRVIGRLATDFQQVGIEPPINNPSSQDDPPTIGFPFHVRDDHTISLPQIAPINVYNMTLHQVEQTIRDAYIRDNILKAEDAMVLVSLQRPRVHRVLVVRQETSNDLTSGSQGTVNLGFSKRGTARTVTLKAYENDVMHALSMVQGADGLPGLDAKNTIYIIRRRTSQSAYPLQPMPQHQPDPQHFSQTESKPSEIQLTGYTPVTEAHRQQVAPVSGHSMAQPTKPWTGGYRSYRGVQPASHSLAEAPGTIQGPSIQPIPAAPQGPQAPVMGGPTQMYSSGRYGHPPAHSMPTLPPATQMQPMPAHSGPAFSHQPGMVIEEDAGHSWQHMLAHFDPTIESQDVVKIPIRLAEGEMPHISEDDITLEDGDIVFIESRETEVFYTGGLLGGGQYNLPRDYDLRVLEAISIAESRNNGSNQLRTIGGVSALNQDVGVSASRVVILRSLPNGQRVNIEVDIRKALRYQAENITIQPGDILMLQYTFPEAVSAFTQRFLLEGALIGVATSMFTTGGGG